MGAQSETAWLCKTPVGRPASFVRPAPFVDQRQHPAYPALSSLSSLSSSIQPIELYPAYLAYLALSQHTPNPFPQIFFTCISSRHHMKFRFFGLYENTWVTIYFKLLHQRKFIMSLVFIFFTV